MIITFFFLILIYAIVGKPTGWLTEMIKRVDWKELTRNAWDKIVLYSKRAGRSATREVLKFYYVLASDTLSTLDKALVYAGILYIVLPIDLLPRTILGWLGILDDVGVSVWLFSKIEDSFTPDIERRVDETLNEWFGPEVVTELVADFREN